MAALLRAKEAGGVGIKDKPRRWGHPKGSHWEEQVLNFTVTPIHLGLSQAKVQGCSKPVCLNRELTRRLW